MNYSISKAACSLLGVSEWLPSRDGNNNNSDALLLGHDMSTIAVFYMHIFVLM